MDYINIVEYKTENDSLVGGDVFIDYNNNGPYDSLFKTLKSYAFYGDLPEKYILNITTPHIVKDEIDLNINPKVLKDLQKGNAKILINRIGEFDSFNNGSLHGLLYPNLFKQLDELNIDKSNVLYMNFNSAVNQSCHKEKINIRYHNFTQMNLYSIIKNKESEYRELFEREKKSLKEYYYLCYNNNPKPHRKEIVDLLLSNKVKGLLSSTSDGIFLDDAKPLTEIVEWPVQNANLYYYANQEHFKNSYFSIITESHFSDDVNSLNLTFTEKTWKPITNFHPFCMVGAKNSLSKLREYGFETFPELFDEGYDASVDGEKRMNDITKGLKRTFLLSIDELSNIYYSMEEKLVHNFHHFFRLCENETKELEKYLLKFCNS